MKKVVDSMYKRQVITSPSATDPTIPNLRKSQKRNLVLLTKPARSKLPKPRKTNMQTFPSSTSQLNWKSTTSKSLTQEAIDVACSMSTNLAHVQGTQLMKTSSTPSLPSPTASTKVIEDPDYCAICTPLGTDCPGTLGLSSDWDEEDNQAKDKDQKQPEASHNIFIMPAQTLKPPSSI